MTAAWLAPEGFDARFSASARRYRYAIDSRELPDPFTARYVWHRPGPLAVTAMRLAARALVGEHDFTSFCRHPGGDRSTVRDVRRLPSGAAATSSTSRSPRTRSCTRWSGRSRARSSRWARGGSTRRPSRDPRGPRSRRSGSSRTGPWAHPRARHLRTPIGLTGPRGSFDGGAFPQVACAVGPLRADLSTMKTYSPKPADIERRWYVIDASGQVLGRLASDVAAMLARQAQADLRPAHGHGRPRDRDQRRQDRADRPEGAEEVRLPALRLPRRASRRSATTSSSPSVPSPRSRRRSGACFRTTGSAAR